MPDQERKPKLHKEPAANLLRRILLERRSNWELAEISKLRDQGKPAPRDEASLRVLRAKYSSPVEPSPPEGVTIPENWVWASLDQLLEGIDAGKNFTCEERPPIHGETGVVKVSAVTWDKFDEEESKTITDPSRIDLRYLIRRGDLLISRANTLELVGASVIVGSLGRTLLLSDKVLRLRLVIDLRNWVNRVLKSHLGRRQIEALATGAQLSMRNITQDNLGKICIPLPPLPEQEKILSRIDEQYSRMDAAERAIDTAKKQIKRYRVAIMKSALEGRLVQQVRQDESFE